MRIQTWKRKPPHTPRNKGLKSDKIRTADSSVHHKVAWLHEVIYTAKRKPEEYRELTISLFVSGYLAVMVAEKTSVHSLMSQHLQDLVSDVELYGWEPVTAFQAIWLQQLEQGRRPGLIRK